MSGQLRRLQSKIAPGLGFKVLGGLLLFFALALSVSIYSTLNGERQTLLSQMAKEGNSLVKALSIFVTEELLVSDYPMITSYTDGLLLHYPDLLSITVQRADGLEVAESSRNLDVSERYVHLYESDVKVGEDTIGRVEIAVSSINYEQFIRDRLKEMVAQSLLVFLSLALVLFIFFRREITDPIHEIVLQSKKLGQGRLDDEVKVAGKGELYQLVSILNEMRENLKHSYDEVNAQNRLLDERVAERTCELEVANEKLVQTHAQLLQSEKMAAIGTLSAGVAHEINNPVGFVVSNMDMMAEWSTDLLALIKGMEKEFGGSKEQLIALKNEFDYSYIKDHMLEIVEESQEGLSRVTRIIADLKTFAHVDEGVCKAVNLHEGLRSTLNILRHEVKHNIHFDLQLGDIPLVECYPSQINQVLMNIIVNAVQSIEGEGQVIIETDVYDEDSVVIRVRDTGCGISPQNQERMMEPFFTTKEVGVGTGLGLSVSFGIVSSHSGRIEVDSEEGVGTTFSIYLPVRQGV